jgi:1,2-diacylglycerol 3-alpha-glucosyltransferase
MHTQEKDRRLAVIWANFGPYHMARARALAKICDVIAIQFAEFQRLYGWRPERHANEFELVTLSNASLEDANLWLLALALWRKLGETKPRLVLVPGYADVPSLTATVWARLHGVPAVLMAESTYIDRPRQWWRELVKTAIVKLLYSYAIVGGKRSREYVARLGILEDRIFLKYDVVDNDFFRSAVVRTREARSRRDYALPAQYFLFVGRLAPEKNIYWLMNTYQHYRRDGGSWDLVIVGQGPLADSLRRHAATLACHDCIHFAGFKNGSELLPYYGFAGCFVLPSTGEPWGLVVNEAMASGLPVLVSNRCGCVDDLVVNGKNGFVFDPADRDELSRRMLQIERMSEEERSDLGRRSLECIGSFRPEDFAEEVSRILRQIRAARC